MKLEPITNNSLELVTNNITITYDIPKSISKFKTSKYNELLNPSILHSLFDQYLLAHVGNSPGASVKFFQEQFTLFTRSLDNKIKIDVNDALEHEINKLKNNSNNIKLNVNMLTTNQSDIEKMYYLKSLTLIIQKYKADVIYPELFLTYEQDIKSNLFVSKIIKLLFNVVEHPKITNNIYILASGYTNETDGHMITFLCNKLSDNLYDVYMCNSGSGIEYHYKEEERNMVEGILYYQFNQTQMQKLIFFNHIFKSHFYTNVINFYNTLRDFLNIEVNRPPNRIQYELAFIKPQLSGSCTYFSLFYLFKVIFYKLYDGEEPEAKFIEFGEQIKTTSVAKIFQYIKTNYIEQNIILPSMLKSIVDICDPKYDPSKNINLIKDYYKTSIKHYLQTIHETRINYDANPNFVRMVRYDKFETPEDLGLGDIAINIYKTKFNNVKELVDKCSEYMEFVEQTQFFKFSKDLAIIHIINLIINNKSTINYKITTGLPLGTARKILDIWKNNSENNVLNWLFFILLLRLNKANNNIFEENIPSSISPNIFKINFHKLYGKSIYKDAYTIEDIELITEYRGLFTEILFINNNLIDLTEVANKNKFKLDTLIYFILQVNKYSFSCTTSFNKDNINVFSHTEWYYDKEKFTIKFHNLKDVTDNLQVGLVTTSNIEHKNNQYIENLIGALKSNPIKLNSLITDTNIYLDDVFCSYDIYNDHQLDYTTKVTNNVNNIELLLGYDKFIPILENLNSYSISVILFICAILIKNNIELIRKYKENIKIFANQQMAEDHVTCFKLILACIEPSIVIVNVDKIVGGNKFVQNILYFFMLYTHRLFNDNYEIYINMIKLFGSITTLNKIEKYFGKLDNIVQREDFVIVNDTYQVMNDNNIRYISHSPYFKQNYIAIKTDNTISLINLERKTTDFTIEHDKLIYYYNDLEYTYTELPISSFTNMLHQTFGNIIIYFYNIASKTYIGYCKDVYTEKGGEIIFIISNNIIQVKYDDDIYTVCQDANPIYTKWLYQIPFCFLIEKDGLKRILLIENKLQNVCLSKGISDTYFCDLKFYFSDSYIISLINNPKNKSYFIDFNPLNEFSSLYFEKDDALILYTFFCIIYSRSDCLKLIFQKFKSVFTEPTKNEFYTAVNNLVTHGCNSIYGSYFKYLYNPKEECNYQQRIEYGYSPSYDIITKKQYRAQTISNIFKYSTQISQRATQIPNAKTKKLNFNTNNAAINECVNEYLATYNRCESEVDNSINILENKSSLLRIKNKILEKIFNKMVENDDIEQVILEYPSNFYKLIDLNTTLNFITKIYKATCNESKKFYEAIDHTILYSAAERSREIILFETLFGNIIRNDQYALFTKMCNRIDKKNEHKVYQMLMGRGKTSVILPLLTVKYSQLVKDILILLPTHLVKQTSNDLLNYSPILRNCEKNIMVADSKTIQTKFLEYKKINTDFNKYKNGLIIIDEFDSLYDPLSSELNIPTKEMNIFDGVQKQSDVNNYIDYVIEQFYQPNNPSIILQECLKLIYNKDYGLPQRNSHQNNFLAVPYSAVNKPINGSQFSELNINITLTIMSYLHLNALRKVDMENIIKSIQQFANYDYFIAADNLTSVIEKNYGQIVDQRFYEKILNNVHSVDEIYLSANEKINDPAIIHWYIKNIVIPSMKYTTSQFNCSFIDIISKYFSEQKIGFSGTINIDLPIWEDKRQEFTKISPNKSDIGSTYFSFLGLDNDEKKLFKINKKENMIQTLIKLIEENNYNCLIDTGAFLKTYNNINVIQALVNSQINKQYIIFITKSDTKMVYDVIKGKSFPYNNQIYDTDKVFIYYDNQHTVGIDIKQPFVLRGLITVDEFNKYTDIAQGMYRLRNLNYGHVVDIVTVIEGGNKSREILLERLLQKDILYKNNSKKCMYRQNAKYVHRLNHNFNIPSYLEEKNGNVNIIDKIVKESAGHKNENLLIKIKTLHDESEASIFTLETEKEKEKEKEKETATESEGIITQIDIADKIIECAGIKFKVHTDSVVSDILDKVGIYFASSYSFGQVDCKDVLIDIKNYFSYSTLGYLYVDGKFIIINNYETTFYDIVNKNPNIIIKRKYSKGQIISDAEYFVRLLIGEKLIFRELLLALKYIYASKINYKVTELLQVLENNYCTKAEQQSVFSNMEEMMAYFTKMSQSVNKIKLFPLFISKFSDNISFDKAVESMLATDYKIIYHDVTNTTSIIKDDPVLAVSISTDLENIL
jgi:hypothetical protein